MGIQLYCGVGETSWNRHPVDTGGYACISPVQGRTIRTLKENRVPKQWGDTRVIQDSGAFQDSWSTRLTFEAALERQIKHAAKYNYAGNIDYRVSYDLLIDECWNADGERSKRRWTVTEAHEAVKVTIAAAEYLAVNRHGLNLILSAQGVDAKQYMDCVIPVIGCMDTTRDSLGLGGWCIIGTRPKQMMPVFRETIASVIPCAAKRGVQKVHIFGVIYPPALGELLWMANEHGITVSTDSTSPANHPFRGQWGYGSWRDNSYQRAHVDLRGAERARHVSLTRAYLTQLENEPEYRAPISSVIPFKRAKKGIQQLSLPFAMENAA
jgi:hypothetical protein